MLSFFHSSGLPSTSYWSPTARGLAQKFGLMILLKVYQRLGYFPKPETIPGAIISHIRAVMKFPADLVPDIASNHTLYRYYAAIRAHLEIQSEGKHVRHIAAQAMHHKPTHDMGDTCCDYLLQQNLIFWTVLMVPQANFSLR